MDRIVRIAAVMSAMQCKQTEFSPFRLKPLKSAGGLACWEPIETGFGVRENEQAKTGFDAAFRVHT